MYGNIETRSYLEKKLVFCFGSYIAAQLLLPFGEENFLSASELKQAQEVDTFLFLLLEALISFYFLFNNLKNKIEAKWGIFPINIVITIYGR